MTQRDDNTSNIVPSHNSEFDKAFSNFVSFHNAAMHHYANREWAESRAASLIAKNALEMWKERP